MPRRIVITTRLSLLRTALMMLLIVLLWQQRQVSSSPSIGDITALILLVQFPDHLNRTLPERQYFEALCTDKITDYLQKQSYGLYNVVSCNVQEWLVTDNTEAFYAAGESNLLGSERSAAFFLPVLEQLDEAGEDWSVYDSDGDGTLDAVLVLHSGYAAEQGEGEACGAGSFENRIHSQGFPESAGVWTSASAGISLSGYCMASVYAYVCDDTTPAEMGVMTHEWMHLLDAVDLYDGRTSTSLGGTGVFDIMSDPWGIANTGVRPASLSPYSKKSVGWLTPTEIVYDGVYTIRTSNKYPDAYVISTGFAPGEFLLIENRQPDDYDLQLPGNGGLLIYHVDNEKFDQSQPGYPGQSGWPANGFHYRVALLQADGAYQLERNVNKGDATDYYTAGMSLEPGGSGNFPNTDSYQFGQVQSTGITITDISGSGETMTFRVTGLGSSPTPSPNAAPIAPPTTPVEAPTPAAPSPNATPTTLPPPVQAPAPPTSAAVMTQVAYVALLFSAVMLL